MQSKELHHHAEKGGLDSLVDCQPLTTGTVLAWRKNEVINIYLRLLRNQSHAGPQSV